MLRDGRSLEIGGKRQRRLLAVLALSAGRVVPTDHLLDELAPDERSDGTGAIKVQVSRLRHALGEGATITGSRAGYRLDLPADRIDAVRFERHVESARGHRATRPRRAAEEAAAALALWRGRPLAGTDDSDLGGTLAVQATRLEELRLEAVELRVEADLALGGGTELVAELEALVAEHPYRERLWRHLMLALYRAGRQADALAAYHRAREALDEQLGIEPSVELAALEAAILRHEVPQPVPPERRHNLPATVTSFVGRTAELAEVREVVGRERLVTLAGVGGVGKTRLGLELARAELGTATDGVWFVDLARLSDPELVPAEVATAIGAPEGPASPMDRIVEQLRERDALLVLDNCEHLVDACAALVERVLAGCPGIRVLATSRVPLGIAGEHTYAVPPLSLAAPAAARSDAVDLFVERARAANPSLSINAEGAEVVERICRDLEGLPLAIELAAARARSLTLPDIAERLHNRFRFLVSWRRVAEARHRTLREAIDWSYELLATPEQRVLERLSVFAGGFDLASAAAVAGPAGSSGDADTLDSLERLIDASLIVRRPEVAGHARFRLLETVRQHAAERLAASGDDAASVERHARYFAALAVAADLTHLDGPDLRLAHERLDADRDNIRAALAWLSDHDEWQELLRVGEAMWRHWWVLGEAVEGRGWLERIVALRDAHLADDAGGDDPALFANTVRGLAGLAWSQGDFEAAHANAIRAATIFEALGDSVGLGRTWNLIGVIEHGRHDMNAARVAFERSIEVYRAADLEPVQRAQLLATPMDNLGSALHEIGDTDRAVELWTESRRLHQEEGHGADTAMMDLHLGRVAVTDGRLEEAGRLLESALVHYSGMRFVQYVTECLEGVGWLAATRADHRLAATTVGAASRLREQTRTPMWGRIEAEVFRYVALAREGLGEAEFEAAWAAGRADPDGAVALALEWLAGQNAVRVA